MREASLSLNVSCLADDPTVKFASEELKAYLTRMTGGKIGNGTQGIRLGLISDFPNVESMSVPDPWADDGIHIDVRDGEGVIAGVNPRSVLISAYRYLTELGCRWVRPGADGEYVPRIRSLRDVRVRETPSYRHRGICIEGAVSREHVTDIIDWAPKLGFNAYFVQFREGHTFFDRWYSHESNPYLDGKHFTVEEARAHTDAAVAAIKKRDMLYHAVGHGWTCEPFGIGGLGWEQSQDNLPEETLKYLAMVNGKRELWGGIALNTNLCYGNPEARRIVVEEIARYAGEHPEIDIMHFWLADGSNNNCECELCRDTRPSDFYVMMLNDLDRLLTARGLPTRIVFLIYVDLLWPPLVEKIANPDRFLLMFAPITRTYSKSFAVGGRLPDLPSFERNKLRFPRSVEENVAFLRAWQQDFQGDSFDFDYHIMWDHFKDPGYTANAAVLSQDIRGLSGIGINGFMSCQVQRAFFPTGLPTTVMGRSLWNSSLSYESIASDYFESAYGPDGALVRRYLERLSELFDPVYLRGEKEAVSEKSAERFAEIPAVAEGFRPVIERNLCTKDPCWAKSWEYMRHHAAVSIPLARACEARARGDRASAAEEWGQCKRYVQEDEMALHQVLDVQFFVSVLGGLFRDT